MRQQPSSPITISIDGGSESLYLLTNSLDGTDVAYAVRPGVATEELGRALFVDGRLKPRHTLEEELFLPRPDNAGVPFQPSHRLMSTAEKCAAVDAFARVATSGKFTSGHHIAEFESILSAFIGIEWVIGTSSGTDGLIVALLATGLTPGDEVIIPANSFAATENAVLACGGAPVLADVSDTCHTLDPETFAQRITNRTRAVIPVHLYGELSRMDEISTIARNHGIAVIEDACQAIGVTGVGMHSDAAVLSFNPYKNLGLCGKAGAILTRHPDVASRCRAISYHGFLPGSKNVKMLSFGLNARIDNANAAIGVALFPFLVLNNFRRALLARRYVDRLAELRAAGRVDLPILGPTNSWHLFPINVAKRGREATHRLMLTRWSIETERFYPVLSHHQDTPLRQAQFAEVRLPNSEAANDGLLCLPLYQYMSLAEQDDVIEALYDVCS
jgi:3-dehydro-glucose-6-phosphate--glutamate transaminase